MLGEVLKSAIELADGKRVSVEEGTRSVYISGDFGERRLGEYADESDIKEAIRAVSG